MINATPQVKKKQMHIGKNQYQIWGNNITICHQLKYDKNNIEAKWAKQNDLLNN